MKVIAVINQKGGVGKTTIAVHLARALQLAGRDVILVDSDPQGSARDWAASKSDQPLTVVGIDRPILDRDARRLGARDFVVIDGAPQMKEMAASAIKAADLVLIPVQPSPYDIWATADLTDLVKQRIEITEGRLKAAFVVSRVITGTRIGRDVAELLAKYELPVLNSTISQRVIFAVSAANGETALDAEPDSAASSEIKALAGEVLEFAGLAGGMGEGGR
jgi:chromosome partitioning protein